MTGPEEEVAVVGAGLVGCTVACFLARRGHRVGLYERRGDPRTAAPERGRSINLALSERGVDALDRLGLAEPALAAALPMRGRLMHAVDGGRSFHAYSAEGRAINSVGRAELNRLLLEAASAASGVRTYFGHRLVDVDVDTGRMRFATPDGEATRRAPVILGADGAYSAVRRQLTKRPGFDYGQAFLDHGYKELTIPARADGGFALDPGALHIWPRGQAMMIALPNADGSFTCTLFWPNTGSGSFAEIDTPEAFEEFFAAGYPDARALMPTVATDYANNPVGSMVTVRCDPWHARGSEGGIVALIGDAAHAIVPFYGQGANCGLEDCVELDARLAAAGDDFTVALPEHGRRRRPDTDVIADLAVDNFIEMRDKVASPVFLAAKNLEHTLERALPGRHLSQYELVSFTTVPYAEVRRRIRRRRLLAAGAATVALGAVALTGWAGRRRFRTASQPPGRPS